ARASAAGEATRTRLGQLDADSISILSDERSNSLLVMAPAADMPSLLSIIEKLDIQLSQVVIETVILAVTFKNSQETGMDWVQRAMLDGAGKDGPALAFATSGGGGGGTPLATTALTTVDSVPKAAGVNAYFTVFDWNMDVVMKAVQNDSNAQIMSSPKITTMDNKEATFESTERIYWKGEETHYASSDYTSQSIKSEDIGIKLTVTPRINNKGYITLTIEQEIQSNDGYTELNGSQYPLLNTRKMGADLAVQSGETVVLGGLAQNSVSKSTTKVPILGSIPLLGWLFRHETDDHNRTDIVVFLTPRVLDTPAQMEDDARNTKASVNTKGVWDPMWSASRLADPISEEQARQALANASNTVTRARYPLTGYLTGLNSPETLDDSEPASGPIREALEKADADGSVPYVHFSDVDASARLRAANFTVSETQTPAPAPEAPEAPEAEPPAPSQLSSQPAL
ncbi:MAG: type II secretion system protein GspD, partial [Kiritimatiellae bacterium]|nr:type II secretion system protein GspD [Kiritimatiellia bacterium]